jgi:hypothetical protein
MQACGVPCGRGERGRRCGVIQLPQIRARIVRLWELTEGLGKVMTDWRHRESLLLPSERQKYFDSLQNAAAAFDAARDALAKAVLRLEKALRQRNNNRK